MPQPPGRTRREIIKRAAAAGAAAWVVPQIVGMSVAGAQTGSCYVLRFEWTGGCSPHLNPSQAATGADCAALFPTTPQTTGNVAAACTDGAGLVSFQYNNGTAASSNQVTATVTSGCQLLFLGGANFQGVCAATSGSGQQLSLQIGSVGFFYVVVGFCCGGGSV